MPYITQEKRDHLDPIIDFLQRTLVTLEDTLDNNMEGNLNYVITKLLHEIYTGDNMKYEHINSAIGVLSCVLNEFYRKVAVPYENQKEYENGSIATGMGKRKYDEINLEEIYEEYELL